MSSGGLVAVSSVDATVEYRTTERRCVTCLTTRSLDDEGPTLGTVRWRISAGDSGVKIGTAISFECLNGHTSEDDPQLLKSFPSRRF
jgi:hypothetical protein